MSKIILKGITVRKSRVVSPVHKAWGPQFSCIIEGQGAEIVGTNSSEPGQYWLNWNASFPNGDPLKPVPQIRGKSEQAPEELGDGSIVDLAFETQESGGNTYYNLKAIRIMKFVRPKSVLDWFDGEVFEESPADAFDVSDDDSAIAF